MTFDIFFSALPIVGLIALMTKKKSMPSYQALPFMALVVTALSFIWFKHEALLVHGSIVTGIVTALTPITIMWGALFLFKAMEKTGSLGTISTWLQSLSPHRSAQAMIVGWAFSFLLEGAGGFGTPVALAAPILVGLGFSPIKTAVMTLIMNSVPVTFGAVGTPVWFGLSRVPGLSEADILEIGTRSALLHGAASLIIPLIGMLVLMPWKEVKRSLGFIYLSVAATVIPYIALSYVSYEFPALLGGIIGTLCSAFFAKKGWGLKPLEASSAATEQTLTSSILVTEQLEMQSPKASAKQTKNTIGGLLLAGFPIWGTTLFLILSRVHGLGIKEVLNATSPALSLDLGTFGIMSISPALVFGLNNIFGSGLSVVHKTLYVPSILPFITIGFITLFMHRSSRSDHIEVWTSTLQRLKKPSIALMGALVFVELLMLGGDRSPVTIIGNAMASLFGGSWQFFSSLLGALGAFFSGSNTVANLTFAGIQNSMAQTIGLDRLTILALQSTGGAYGHMVAIGPVVSVCTMLGLVNKEGEILRKVTPILLLYAVIVGSVSYLFW